MVFDWNDFLTLATYLRQRGAGSEDIPTAAAYRTAVGCAYYAAFGHALRYADNWLGFISTSKAEEKSRDHGRLKAFLKTKKRARVAENLDDLREWRNACDYEETLPFQDLADTLDAALRKAEYIFQALVPPKSATNGEVKSDT